MKSSASSNATSFAQTGQSPHASRIARITGADDRSGQTEYLENFILEARVDARSHLVGSIDFSDRNRIIHGCETWKFDMMTPVF